MEAAKTQALGETTNAVEKQESELVKELRSELDAKGKIILALEGELTKLNETKGAEKKVPTVKIGKKTCFVTVPRFNYKGQVYTAADVVNDPKLAAALYEEKSGVLEESND